MVSRATDQRKHTPHWWRIAQEFALTDPEYPVDKDEESEFARVEALEVCERLRVLRCVRAEE